MEKFWMVCRKKLVDMSSNKHKTLNDAFLEVNRLRAQQNEPIVVLEAVRVFGEDESQQEEIGTTAK